MREIIAVENLTRFRNFWRRESPSVLETCLLRAASAVLPLLAAQPAPAGRARANCTQQQCTDGIAAVS